MMNEKYQVIKERCEELGIGTFNNPTEVVTKVDALEMALNAYDIATESCQGEVDNLAAQIAKLEKFVMQNTTTVKAVSNVPKVEKEVKPDDKNGETKK